MGDWTGEGGPGRVGLGCTVSARTRPSSLCGGLQLPTLTPQSQATGLVVTRDA